MSLVKDRIRDALERNYSLLAMQIPDIVAADSSASIEIPIVVRIQMRNRVSCHQRAMILSIENEFLVDSLGRGA